MELILGTKRGKVNLKNRENSQTKSKEEKLMPPPQSKMQIPIITNQEQSSNGLNNLPGPMTINTEGSVPYSQLSIESSFCCREGVSENQNFSGAFKNQL